MTCMISTWNAASCFDVEPRVLTITPLVQNPEAKRPEVREGMRALLRMNWSMVTDDNGRRYLSRAWSQEQR